MGYYDPPEPEAEGIDTFACSMEVERKFITPEMETHLKVLRDGPSIPDPWKDTRSPEAVAELTARARERAVEALLTEWRLTEPHVGKCGWSGEADYVVWNDSIQWTCPSCGEEHDDESAEERWGPGEDYWRELAADMEYDQMKEDALLERLREDEADYQRNKGN